VVLGKSMLAKVWLETEGDHLEDVLVDGRILSMCILRRMRCESLGLILIAENRDRWRTM